MSPVFATVMDWECIESMMVGEEDQRASRGTNLPVDVM
jgi:hypothetical protein